jgi:hypothetical protein
VIVVGAVVMGLLAIGAIGFIMYGGLFSGRKWIDKSKD